MNIYIVYEINKNFNISDYTTLKNCLFGAVSLAKNADTDKYKYSGFGTGSDRHGFSSHPSGGNGTNLITFGVDMSSSTKIYNSKKDILILGKGPTQGSEHTMSAEKCIHLILQSIKKFSLRLRYNGANSYLFVNCTKIHKFKAKDSEIAVALLCLGNISKDSSVGHMKKTGLNGHAYCFSVDDAIAAADILDIYKYLMKKISRTEVFVITEF